MSAQLLEELTGYLAQARDLEQLDLALLGQGFRIARYEKVRAIYRSHLGETEEHLRLIEMLLMGRGRPAARSPGRGTVGTLQIRLEGEEACTPARLAVSAYAFENLEIAVYRVVDHLARRCHERAIAATVERILEQEEQAAELLAGTFDRALAASLR